MRVIGTVNEPRKIRYVDEVLPPSGPRRILSVADFVVLSLPLTEKTTHIIGAAELSAMKPNAYLINVGRGKLIDEGALIAALQDRRIAGAALDVFANEPLPANSPLWNMENVSVTPHYSGMAEGIWEKVAGLFCENAVRYMNGKRMLGIVNRVKGY
jgi:phosphoglycerate dehydrogenase-like enzyme